jgi:hypothetical protein
MRMNKLTRIVAATLLAGMAFAPAVAVAKKEKQKPPSKQLPAASEQQKKALELVHMGEYQCELGQSLTVTPHSTEGYAEVGFKRYRFTMTPVLSSTGAVRLEDVSGRALMVQIANKSMLMDNKVGQRLVDDCVSAGQKSAADSMKTSQAPTQ